MRKLIFFFAFCLFIGWAQASPITGLLERIDPYRLGTGIADYRLVGTH